MTSHISQMRSGERTENADNLLAPYHATLATLVVIIQSNSCVLVSKYFLYDLRFVLDWIAPGTLIRVIGIGLATYVTICYQEAHEVLFAAFAKIVIGPLADLAIVAYIEQITLDNLVTLGAVELE